jgi:hypothetical protein
MGVVEFLTSFIHSWFFMYFIVPVIVFFVILWVISTVVYNEPIGVVIGRWMGRRPLKIGEIEIDANGMALKDFRASSKISKPYLAKKLFIESTDSFHYATEGGRHFIGKISGMATYPSHDEITVRQPWHLKKWQFVYPPDLLVSSSCSKNIIVKGISVKTKGDMVWPILGKNQKYTEDYMDQFQQATYDMRVTQNQNMMTRNLVETSIAKAFADNAAVRYRNEALKHHIALEEVSDADRNSSPPSKTNGT